MSRRGRGAGSWRAGGSNYRRGEAAVRNAVGQCSAAEDGRCLSPPPPPPSGCQHRPCEGGRDAVRDGRVSIDRPRAGKGT